MVANVNPIFAARGQLPFSPTVTLANTAQDGTGTVDFLQIAGATWIVGADGAFVIGIRFKSKGANASSSLARVFVNNGGVNTTAANNIFIDEMFLPITALSQTAVQAAVMMPIGFILPAGHRVFITLATAAAGGWQAMAIVGDYTFP